MVGTPSKCNSQPNILCPKLCVCVDKREHWLKWQYCLIDPFDGRPKTEANRMLLNAARSCKMFEVK
jgi:hypothetical protein